MNDATTINGARYGLLRCPSCEFEFASWLPELHDPWLCCPYDEHDPKSTEEPELICVLVPAESIE